MSTTDNVPMLKIFCGNVPVNWQLERLRMVRDLKWANVFGTADDKLFPSRTMTDRFSSLAREGSRGPERLQYDKPTSCRSCSDIKALHHSCPAADILTPSKYSCLILVRFWTSLCRFGSSSFSLYPVK